MIVVKVEMWPGGDAAKKRMLSVMKVWNVRVDTETGERGYRIEILKDTSFTDLDMTVDENLVMVKSKDVWKKGMVRGHFPGKRGLWDLLGGSLAALLRERLSTYRGMEEPE